MPWRAQSESVPPRRRHRSAHAWRSTVQPPTLTARIRIEKAVRPFAFHKSPGYQPLPCAGRASLNMQHEQQLLLAQQAQSDACLRTEQRIPLLARGRDGGGSCYRTAAAHVGEIMAAARMAAYGRGALAYLPTGDSYDPVCANSELNHEQFDTAPDLATTALYTIARMLPEPATGVSVTPSATTTNQPNSRAIGTVTCQAEMASGLSGGEEEYGGPDAAGGGDDGASAGAPAVKNHKKYRKPKPWDTDGARGACVCAVGWRRVHRVHARVWVRVGGRH
jgi:hypothetical protein